LHVRYIETVAYQGVRRRRSQEEEESGGGGGGGGGGGRVPRIFDSVARWKFGNLRRNFRKTVDI